MYDLQASKSATMSSKVLAEVSGKRHDNVVRTLQSLADKRVISIPQFEESPTPGGGKPFREYFINERDSYVVMARLSPEFTGALVDRWQALESGQALPLAAKHDSLEADKAHAEWLASFAGLDKHERLMLSNNISKKHGLSAIIDPQTAATPTTKSAATAYTLLREELHGAIVDAYNWSTDPSTWRWMTASEILAECGYASPDRSQQTIVANAVREINGNRAKRAAGRRQLAVPATYVPA